jgi:4a-hydroxytetrahydrobiopterin dehydratase
MEKLSIEAILDAELREWRKLAQALHARYRTPDFSAGAAFVSAVASVCEASDHNPEIKMTGESVALSLCTHQAGRWVTQKDLDMARAISDIARAQGLTPDPAGITQLELALDTAHENRVGPFWSAVLTGSPANKIYDSVFDPEDRVPAVWFQGTDEHETPRQRWHFDLWVAPEEAESRIERAVAAGGTVIDDSEAPSFTVIADPDGNKVCICTYLGRE